MEAVGLGGGIGTSLSMLGEQPTIHGSTFPATIHAQVALGQGHVPLTGTVPAFFAIGREQLLIQAPQCLPTKTADHDSSSLRTSDYEDNNDNSPENNFSLLCHGT